MTVKSEARPWCSGGGEGAEAGYPFLGWALGERAASDCLFCCMDFGVGTPTDFPP